MNGHQQVWVYYSDGTIYTGWISNQDLFNTRYLDPPKKHEDLRIITDNEKKERITDVVVMHG